MQKVYTLFIFFFLYVTVTAQTQVQFINNSADSIMASVKVLMNGDLKKDSLGYRKATPFLSTAGDSIYTVVFQSKVNAAQTASITQTLQSGKKYVFILNGVTNDTTFQKNPDSVSILLNIVFIDQSTLPVPSSNEVTLGVVNGSTDAPAFDLTADDSSGTLLADSVSLNNSSGAVVRDTTLRLKVRTADGAFNISTFLFSLTGFGGQTVTALTSGFLAPGSNHNGPNFSVYFVDSSGNVISAQNVSLVKERNNLVEKILLYPNPANEMIHLVYTLSQTTALQYSIFNVKGEVVQSNTLGVVSKGINEQQLTLQDLPSGIYYLQLRSEISSKTVSFIVQ